ncbi:hypothetical protein BRD56_03170 [Thermoplasmatales archaeon SW_10_69_26]|nr:MAG: hypothetical protein BRD56_03170 [Thermoplasmatales archaeon SW_10_69_26]
MGWDPPRHLPFAAGLSLIVAAIGLVAPWWTLRADAGSSGIAASVSPFDPGPLDSVVNGAAVVAVGVLTFVGLVGGLVLRFQGENTEMASTAGWLWMASGGFLLVAPLTAVLTWPAEDLSFWGSASAAGASFSAAADWGWYLTLVAGAIAAVTGMAWLLIQERYSLEHR